MSRSLVLLWRSESRHKIVDNLLNLSETDIKGRVQIVVWGIACFLASCIALIWSVIATQTSACVACLRFIGLAEFLRIWLYLFQSAALMFSQVTFLNIGFVEIVSFIGTWSEVLILSGVM